MLTRGRHLEHVKQAAKFDYCHYTLYRLAVKPLLHSTRLGPAPPRALLNYIPLSISKRGALTPAGNETYSPVQLCCAVQHTHRAIWRLHREPAGPGRAGPGLAGSSNTGTALLSLPTTASLQTPGSRPTAAVGVGPSLWSDEGAGRYIGDAQHRIIIIIIIKTNTTNSFWKASCWEQSV